MENRMIPSVESAKDILPLVCEICHLSPLTFRPKKHVPQMQEVARFVHPQLMDSSDGRIAHRHESVVVPEEMTPFDLRFTPEDRYHLRLAKFEITRHREVVYDIHLMERHGLRVYFPTYYVLSFTDLEDNWTTARRTVPVAPNVRLCYQYERSDTAEAVVPVGLFYHYPYHACTRRTLRHGFHKIEVWKNIVECIWEGDGRGYCPNNGVTVFRPM